VAPEQALDPSAATDDLADCARTMAYAARHLERALGELTVPQFRVLSFLDRSPERASGIAAKAGVTKPSLTGIIDGLVARGWVRRVEVDGDRRGVALEITDLGRTALRRATAEAAAHLDGILALVDDRDRAAVISGLQALSRALVEHRRAALAHDVAGAREAS